MALPISLTWPPKVVVFDFSGTLLDDLYVAAYGNVKEIFGTYGLPCPTLEQFREEITAGFSEFYYHHGFSRSTTPDELNAIRTKFYKEHRDSLKMRPDVARTVDQLLILGFHTAIVSAEITTILHWCLIQNGLQRKFDFIRAEAWGCKDKALLQAAEVFGVSPGEMIYVDDTVDGLTSAKDVGVIAIALLNPTAYSSESRLEKIADLCIKEIGELKKLLST